MILHIFMYNVISDFSVATPASEGRVNLLMGENSNRKIIGLYFNGYTMTNTKYWSLYYCGYRALKILNKKKYKDYTKGVYIFSFQHLNLSHYI